MDREYQQLRFDISEKVRLHPQQPGIKTLVELDLYPDGNRGSGDPSQDSRLFEAGGKICRG